RRSRPGARRGRRHLWQGRPVGARRRRPADDPHRRNDGRRHGGRQVSNVDTTLLADVLKRATARGATAADGFLIEEQSFSASVRLGQVDTVAHSREQRLALRVFSGRASAAATSHGFARGYSTSSFGLTVSPVAAKDGEMQRDVWYTYARRRRALDDPESVGRTAAARALRRLGARKVKTTEVPVIFDPDTAAS